MDQRSFIDLVASLFESEGYQVIRGKNINGLRLDLQIKKDDRRSPVEIILDEKDLSRIAIYAARASSFRSIDGSLGKPILVLGTSINKESSKLLQNAYGINVLDIEELINRSSSFPALREGFLSVSNKNRAEYFELQRSETKSELVAKLKCHNHGEKLTPKQYEELCKSVMQFLFADSLTHFISQHSTSDGRNRFDFICRISSDRLFWKTLSSDFRTRSVIFECKNYEEKITADQVYSTERYLFAAALRTVCFLISKRGPDAGCVAAAQGALREANKLILLLSNDDLIEMLELSDDLGAAETKLDEMIWNFIAAVPR